jgi:copper(I)-binding protein
MLGLVLTACAPRAQASAALRVENAWARAAAIPVTGAQAASGAETPSDMGGMSGGMGAQTPPASHGAMPGDVSSAVYFVIVNDGNAADTLTGVDCAAADRASLHQTRIVNDVAEMVPVASLVIPAHGRVEFQPGGYHVMLEGLKQDLTVGETIRLSLRFEKGSPLVIDVPVRQP